MTLCWVAGLSGTGKSTIVRELQSSGELAWDADDFCFWRNRETGEREDPPAGGRPDGWVAQHGWAIDPSHVERCRASAHDQVGYLAGGCENEAEVRHLFDLVVYLVTDDATIRRRLAARTENDYGKTEEELAVILGWNQVLEGHYRSAGARIIDAGRPLPQVVEDVRSAGVQHFLAQGEPS